jgi:UDP-glucose 4-epimerase
MNAQVLGIDIQPPARKFQNCEHRELDICSNELGTALKDFNPDTIIHSAFVFKPMRDEQEMRRINVEGCKNVLAAVEEVRPERFLTVSSATAYGAWPDNPIPIPESWPLRASRFQYASDKTEIESLLDTFSSKHTGIATSWVRPSIIGGPGLDNYLSRFIFGMPIIVLIDGNDVPLQFVHEQDVVSAIGLILRSNATGAFNVGPSDASLMSEIAKHSNRRAVKLPFWLVRAFHSFAWLVRFPIHESPATLLDFARYPWVVSPERIQTELGFKFQYSSQDTLDIILDKQHD